VTVAGWFSNPEVGSSNLPGRTTPAHNPDSPVVGAPLAASTDTLHPVPFLHARLDVIGRTHNPQSTATPSLQVPAAPGRSGFTGRSLSPAESERGSTRPIGSPVRSAPRHQATESRDGGRDIYTLTRAADAAPLAVHFREDS